MRRRAVPELLSAGYSGGRLQRWRLHHLRRALGRFAAHLGCGGHCVIVVSQVRPGLLSTDICRAPFSCTEEGEGKVPLGTRAEGAQGGWQTGELVAAVQVQVLAQAYQLRSRGH